MEKQSGAELDGRIETFNEIKALYRDRGAGKEGYDTLKRLIVKNDIATLLTLLRDHRIEGIYTDEEVISRDNVDYLMQYYSLIAVGMLGNLLPQQLGTDMEQEVKLVLTNEAVIPYYTNHYPLFLPQLLLKAINADDPIIDNVPYQTAYPVYMQAIDLITQRVNDKNIEMFLWFMDDGYAGNENINSLIAMLQNDEALQESFNKKHLGLTDMALRGMINYYAFMDEFYDLLQKLNDYRLFQSAVWHLEGYWFREIRSDLENIIDVTIQIAQEKKNDFAELQDQKASMDLFKNKVTQLLSDQFATQLVEML